ncbi:hypothetical protein [Baaleninema simplex]|uniref:hypothetical protein n=1 Tax=Baaleninema simplex TaxID=2862350 RepID=UPI00034DA8FC|nr:hypothetical protein [Baaleninema simplex]
METNSSIQITVSFVDTDLDEDEKEMETQRLFNSLKKLDEVERVDRVLDPNPPQRNKAFGGFLIGLLTAEVTRENVEALFRFLGDRLSGKTIDLKVEVEGKVLEVSASSREELEFAIQQAMQWAKA